MLFWWRTLPLAIASVTALPLSIRPSVRSGHKACASRCTQAAFGSTRRCRTYSSVSDNAGDILPQDKEVWLIRHGVTEMNEWLARPGCQWGAPHFKDAGLWDTRLTPRGKDQAMSLGHQLLAKDPQIELLVASPLTRALSTATFAFAPPGGGIVSPAKRSVACSLISERVYLSSDVGRPIEELALDFGNSRRDSKSGRSSPTGVCFDFSDLRTCGYSNQGLGPQGEWWYHHRAEGKAGDEGDWRPPGTYYCPGEPLADFQARLLAFKEWLSVQPEQRVAVVAHWGVIRALTGKDLNNCEVVQTTLHDLLSRPLTKDV